MTDQGSSDLELRLRSALARERPPDGPSEALRARIAAIPEIGPVASRLGRWRWMRASLAASLTVLGLALVSVAIWLRGGARGSLVPAPGAGGNPTPMAFDPAISGPGIQYDAPIALAVVTGGVALVSGVFALRALIRWRGARRWRDVIVGATLAAIAAGSIGLGLAPGFTWANSFASGIGFTMVEPLPGSVGGVPVLYETVGPNEPVAVVFDIRNPGPLPLTLLGVVEDPNAVATRRWTAVWLGRHSNVIGFTDDTTIFQPTTVQPGDSVVVYLVGKSGPCAYGPGYASAQDVGGYTNRGRQLRLAYSLLGLPTSAEITPPMEIVEPIRNAPCP